MADLESIERQLELLIALTRVGVRDQLAKERRLLFEDDVNRAILMASEDWISAGKLKEAVQRETGQSEPTVKRRLSELVSRGALIRRGAGRAVSYRSSGLFDI
jgi:DNA-binding transcriptional regulator PaaX